MSLPVGRALSLVHVLPSSKSGALSMPGRLCTDLVALWPSVAGRSAPLEQIGDFPVCTPRCLVC